MNAVQPTKKNPFASETLSNLCLISCRKLAAQIEKTKNAIRSQFHQQLEAHEHLLRLALNEAEAIACETDFPHLVFPMLATEKAQTVATWLARQRSMKLDRLSADLPPLFH